MDDLVRRKDLLDALAYSSDSWAGGVQGIRAWWPHAVQIKDNFVREIEKLEAVPEASVDRLTELLVAEGHQVNARSLAKCILDNSALFATNHLPLERKVRSECPSNDYCKGWNDAVGQMAASHMQAMPCRVGDKLWMALDEVEVVEVSSVSFGKTGCVIELSYDGALYGKITPEDIGKYVFFSEEEAIAAVEECKKTVDELIDDAWHDFEKVSNDTQKTAPLKKSYDDPAVWGGADAFEGSEEDYDFY